MRDDLRHALRIFRRHPGFAVLAVLVLAIGIGANTALFGVIDGVLLSPLRLHEPGRLVQVERVRQSGNVDRRFEEAEYRALLDAGVFEDLAAVWDARREAVFVIGGIPSPERARGARVSPNFMTLLGARVALGRTFDARLDEGGDRRVAVLSHRLWRTVFLGDSSIVGRSITLNEEDHTVVGVLAADVDMPGPQGTALEPAAGTQLWVPIPARIDDPRLRNYDRLIARLRADASPGAAEGEAARVLAGVDEGVAADRVLRLTPLRDRLVGESRVALYLLLAVVAVVLLLTCVNLAGLQLARTLRRRPEIAIRSAVGASRARLARQYFVEGLVLATAGGGAGLLLAVWLQQVVMTWAPSTLPRPDAAQLGFRALGFTVVVTAVAALVSSLSPMWEAARPDATRGLKEGRYGAMGRKGRRLRSALASVQVALAVVLLSGSALLVMSLIRLQSADLGYRPAGVLAVDLYRETIGDPAADPRPFYAEILERVRSLATVEGAALASSIPARHRDYYTPEWRLRIVGDGYFELLGTPVVEGRAFSGGDPPPGSRVAVVNETLARREFGELSPVGRTLGDLLIIGVVADVRHERPDEPALPAAYEPVGQRSDSRLTLLARSRAEPAALSEMLRSAIRDVDPRQPVGEAVPLSRILEESPAMAERAFYLRLVGTLSAVALVLALMGVYGVIAQLVADGTREFGVRIALGASPARIGRLVLRRAFGIVAVGIPVGLVAGQGVGRLLRTFLYQLGPADLVLGLGVAACVVGAALAAAWVPARRATRVSPALVIKAE